VRWQRRRRKRGERGRLDVKTRCCDTLTGAKAAKAKAAWRARTRAIRSGATVASDTAIGDARGEAAIGLSGQRRLRPRRCRPAPSWRGHGRVIATRKRHADRRARRGERERLTGGTPRQ
jgi:hypothetical protein